MAGSTVTSTLDIRLVDDVSPAAAKVAAALQKMEAEALAVDAALAKSGASDRFAANLKRIGAQAPQIEGVAKAYADFARAQGIALGGGGKLTAEQTKAVKAWETTTLASVKAVMRVDKERDTAALASFEKTTALWRQETAAHAREVERQVADDRRAAEQRAQLHAREAEREIAAERRHQQHLMEQREHGIAHHGIVNYALQSAAAAVSAHALVHVGREAWEQGAELQHERLGLQNAGRTPEEIREIERAARGVQANTPTSGYVESLKTVAETTAAFGSVEHAVANLPFISKMTSILKTAGGNNIHGDAAQLGQAFAKTFEERQTKPQDFEREAKAMIPAMVATGGTFNPEQLYAFAQQAKSALPSLSMRFLSRIAPSLIGAQGGERAGTGLKAFEDVIAGKVNDKKQAEEFLNLGLLDPKMAIMKAGHAVGWKSGAVKDTFLAMTDPLAWSEKYLIPALKAKGVDTDSREATQMILNTMFRNQNANMFATEIAQAASIARLHKDEDLFGKTGSFDEIYARNLQDFGVAAGALRSALGNLAGAVTAPLMGKVAVGLNFLAGQIDHLSNLALEHPTIAATGGVAVAGASLAGAGWAAYGLYNGFGLRGSAVALDDAAGHLMEVGGGPGGFANKLPAAVVPAAEALPGAAAIPGAVTLGAAAVAGGAAVVATEVIKKWAESQEPGKGGLYAGVTEESRVRDQQGLEVLRSELDDLKAKVAHQKAREKLPGTSDEATYADRLRIRQLETAITDKERSFVNLDAIASSEARAGRAYGAMRRPEEFGPNLPPELAGQMRYIDREAERGRAYAGIRPTEEFGPPAPPVSPLVPRPGDMAIQKRTFGRFLGIAGAAVDEGTYPAASRTGNGPLPSPAAPTVDTSSIDAAKGVAAEAGAAMAAALNVTASPSVDLGAINAASAAVDALAAKLRAIGALAANASAAISAAAGGGAPPPGTFRAAANRSFAGASQTG